MFVQVMMRQAQQRSSSPSHDDQQESSERATPISALAPEVDLNQEQPAVLSLNPALQCLEQVKSHCCNNKKQHKAK